MRSSRGSSLHRMQRRSVSRLMRKFNRQRLATCRNVHRLVREDLKPKATASRLITIGDEIIDDQTAEHIWIEFVRAQTSWSGQIAPEQLLDLYQGWSTEPPCLPPMPEEAKQLHHCTLKAVSESPLVSRSRALVQWSELCDAIACINLRAAPPPTEPIPVLVLSLPSEALRACLIGLLNLVILTDHLPATWSSVVVMPLTKPGKPRQRIESHRPISLMPLGLKLLDRILFRRIWPAIRAQACPWQLGGSKGPDVSFAFLGDVLRLRSANLVNCIVIFLDGQSAFCRPPALAVVASLRRLPGVLEHSILAIHTLLSGLRSRVAIFGSVHPPFKNEVGLPQGGSLSTALFVLLSLPLYDALCDNGTACKLNLAEDVFNIPAAGYVDDIALLSADPVKRLDLLQRKVARMLLGHGKRSPASSCLVCLGWTPWSFHVAAARLGLLQRVFTDGHNFMAQLFHTVKLVPGTWAHLVNSDLQQVFGRSGLPSFASWARDLQTYRKTCRILGWQHVVDSCFAHFNLTHFPMRAATDIASRRVILSLFEMPNVTVTVDLSLLVLRLFTGGQGLRAGDLCGSANKWADAEGIHHAGPLGIGQEAHLESKMWQVSEGVKAHAGWGSDGGQADLAALGSLVPAAWTLLGSAATDLGSDLWEVSSSAVPVPAAAMKAIAAKAMKAMKAMSVIEHFARSDMADWAAMLLSSKLDAMYTRDVYPVDILCGAAFKAKLGWQQQQTRETGAGAPLPKSSPTSSPDQAPPLPQWRLRVQDWQQHKPACTPVPFAKDARQDAFRPDPAGDPMTLLWKRTPGVYCVDMASADRVLRSIPAHTPPAGLFTLVTAGPTAARRLFPSRRLCCILMALRTLSRSTSHMWESTSCASEFKELALTAVDTVEVQLEWWADL
eukprot:s10318_g1.t1